MRWWPQRPAVVRCRHRGGRLRHQAAPPETRLSPARTGVSCAQLRCFGSGIPGRTPGAAPYRYTITELGLAVLGPAANARDQLRLF